MDVAIDTYPDGTSTIFLRPAEPGGVAQKLSAMTEHDLRDIEFVLAQRRAMSKRCPETDGEHTCSVFPGHPVVASHRIGHQCRACAYRWFHSGRPENQEDAACATPTESG